MRLTTTLLALTLLLWTGLPHVLHAQFSIEPTDSLVAEFPTDSLTRIFQIDFPNETPDSLGLTWRYIDGGWADGWDVNLCDFGECYTGVPSDADMLPMPEGGAGFLKLIVNSLDIEGTCFLHFWVWPTDNPDALVNVWFDLHNGGVNAVADTPRPIIEVHPNPCRAGQRIVLSMPPNGNFHPTMQRLTPDGRLLNCTPERSDGRWLLSTEGWPTGMYLLRWTGGDRFERLMVH
jgi:hypothetical protein